MSTPPDNGPSTEFAHEDFVEIFTEHSRQIYRFILTVIANRSDADDVFQATSLVLYKKFGDFDPAVGTFGSWACRIAYLEVLSARRRKRRSMILSDEVIELLQSDTVRRSEELDTREAVLDDCIEKLPKKDRQLIEDRYFNEYTPKQIASRSSRSVHAIYRSLARVHGMVRRCVERAQISENS